MQLGTQVVAGNDPATQPLETVEAPSLYYGVAAYVVRLVCPEFTSLCPVTGQPDFATIVVDYVPHERLVESKSFKLFMVSFRNHGAFHEAATVMIGRRLEEALDPQWLRVSAFFEPRGGIPIDVFWQTDEAPTSVHIPPVSIPSYRGR